jgi:hypothetical protein
VGDFLDHYYYFSLMPAAVLTILLALTSMTALPAGRAAQIMGAALFAASLAIAPARIAFGRTLHQMPEYGVLLDASRKIARIPQPMRAIHTEFPLPPSTDPEFLYTILGGRIDRASRVTAVVKPDGQIVFEEAAYVDRR